MEVVKLMMLKDLKVMNSKVLVLKSTFEEEYHDIRKTRVIDIYKELTNFDIQVDSFDPLLDPNEVDHEYGINVDNSLPIGFFSAVVLAISHKVFLTIDVRSVAPSGIVNDVNGILPKELIYTML